MGFIFWIHLCDFEKCNFAHGPLKVKVSFKMSPKQVKTLGTSDIHNVEV